MKNFLIGYTTLVAFIVITMVSAMVLPSNTETSIALDNGTLGEMCIRDRTKNGQEL